MDKRFNLMISNDGENGSACIFDKKLGLIEMLILFEENDDKEDYCTNLQRIVDLLNNYEEKVNYYETELNGLDEFIQDRTYTYDTLRFEKPNSAFRNEEYMRIMDEISKIGLQVQRILKKD